MTITPQLTWARRESAAAVRAVRPRAPQPPRHRPQLRVRARVWVFAGGLLRALWRVLYQLPLRSHPPSGDCATPDAARAPPPPPQLPGSPSASSARSTRQPPQRGSSGGSGRGPARISRAMRRERREGETAAWPLCCVVDSPTVLCVWAGLVRFWRAMQRERREGETAACCVLVLPAFLLRCGGKFTVCWMFVMAY
jgi:hypothetical protein